MKVVAPLSLTVRSRNRFAKLRHSDFLALAVVSKQYAADVVLRIHDASCDTFCGSDCDCRPLSLRNGGEA